MIFAHQIQNQRGFHKRAIVFVIAKRIVFQCTAAADDLQRGADSFFFFCIDRLLVHTILLGNLCLPHFILLLFICLIDFGKLYAVVKLIRHQCADIIREGFAFAFLAGGIPHKMLIEDTVDIVCLPGRFFAQMVDHSSLDCDSFLNSALLQTVKIRSPMFCTAIQFPHSRQIPTMFGQKIFCHAKRCEVSVDLNV